eukprot:NODE_21332_length_759_cov_1.689873.p2 GENE.NODE_21332_length_759_cov_1.689873~~NODE_21332_length_759_cov_1.689873.p2  ORF type:complete len:101 (-),score=17.94 NODE_21332_length_759_cov_1.689873:246-548(-)
MGLSQRSSLGRMPHSVEGSAHGRPTTQQSAAEVRPATVRQKREVPHSQACAAAVESVQRLQCNSSAALPRHVRTTPKQQHHFLQAQGRLSTHSGLLNPER